MSVTLEQFQSRERPSFFGTLFPDPVALGGGTSPKLAVGWSLDDTLDVGEISALLTSIGNASRIPPIPGGQDKAHLIMWTAENTVPFTGVTVTRQFGDQANLFDNVNVELGQISGINGTARITVNRLSAAYVGEILSVIF